MIVCPSCKIWPVKPEDIFCSFCKTKLVSLSIPAEVLYFKISRWGLREEFHQTLEFRNESRAGADVINSAKISLDAGKDALKCLEFALDDQEVKLPLADISIEPNQFRTLKITLDTGKLEKEEETYFKLDVKSSDPDLPSREVDICVSVDDPEFAFLSSGGKEEEVDSIDFGEVMVSPDPIVASKQIVREALLKNKGGGILKLKESTLIPGEVEGLSVKTGKASLRKGESTSITFTLDPRLLPPKKENYELEAKFSFDEVEDEKTIRISFAADSPPYLNLFLEGFKPDPEEKNTLVAELPKLRRKNYIFRLQNIGGGTCEIKKIEKDAEWLRLYQGGYLKYQGEELAEGQCFCKPGKDSVSFHLMVDTYRMQIGSFYEGKITIYSNAVNSPSIHKLKVESVKRGLVEDYVGIDFGTTNSCIAIYRKTVSGTDGLTAEQTIDKRFEVVKLEGKDTIPSRLFFRELDDPVLGQLAIDVDKYGVSKSLRSLKRQIGSSVEREIGGREFTPEELTEIIFRKLINMLADRLEGQPTKIIATCPANFDNAQRSTILSSLRRVVLKTLVDVYSEELVQKINESPACQFHGRESPWKARLRALEDVPCCSDSERYRLPENGFSLADVLVNMLRFGLRHRYELTGSTSPSTEYATVVNLYKSFLRQMREAYPFLKTDFDLENENRLLPMLDLLEQFAAEKILAPLRLSDVKLLDEPSAAAYYYICRNSEDEAFCQRVRSGADYTLVYDFGGGTLDVSIVRISSSNAGSEKVNVDVVATGGNNRLGGDDIDLAVVEAMLDQLREQEKPAKGFKEKDLIMCNTLDLKEEIKAKKNLAGHELTLEYGRLLDAKYRLKDRAEELKIYLSRTRKKRRVDVLIPAGQTDTTLKFELSNDEFNSLVHRFAEESIELVKKVLMQARRNLSVDDLTIGQVILAGKTSRIPLIKEMMLRDEDLGWTKDVFYTDIEGREKTCVAQGAVSFGNVAQYKTLNVVIGARRLTHHFGYVTGGGLFGLPRFFSLDKLVLGAPYSDSSPLEQAAPLGFEPNQTHFYHIAQSKTDNPNVDMNPDLIYIGNYLFMIPEEDVKRGETVSLRFSVDPNGIVSVQGFFREKPVGRFTRYTVRKDEAKPYIFV